MDDNAKIVAKTERELLLELKKILDGEQHAQAAVAVLARAVGLLLDREIQRQEVVAAALD